MKPKNQRYTIAVDFDGVIHSYNTPWVARHVIPDPPVAGAIEWLWLTLQKMDVVIFSMRCHSWRGRRAVRQWLRQYSGALYHEDPAGGIGLEDLKLSATKPAALVYLDDRAMRFEGTFPTVEQIHRAKPWNKNP